MRSHTDASTARTALIVSAVAALFLIAFFVLRAATQVLLLVFAAVLFGTALRGLAQWLSKKTGLRLGVSLAICVVVLVLLAAGAGSWIVPNVADQTSTLAERLSQAYATFTQALGSSPLGQRVTGDGSLGQQLARHAARAAGVLASAVGALGSLVFVFFVALYLAGSPGVYRRGVVQLVPPRYRERADEVLDDLAHTLRRWLVGRIVSMTAVGVVTTLGLWALGIPLPVTLGLIAGALGFVPNIGPIVSAIPALLLALTVSPMHVVYVAALYLVINLGDGYLLTPWVQERAVAVPPALILTGQVLLGALGGLLGVMFATPLLACVLVIVRELYVEDILEHGERTRAAAAERPRARERSPD